MFAWATRHFDLIVTLLYACVVGWLLYQHDMFDDEGQEWLIARASHSLGELYRNRAYEGHPIPWYLIIWPFARASENIAWIKLPNFFIASAAIYLTCRLHLRNPLEKTLFAFGALMVFYYGVLARPYMLGYLLLVLACHYATKPHGRTRAIMLAGMMATLHAYFVVIAGTLVAWVLLAGTASPIAALRRLTRRDWAACAFAIVCAAATVMQVTVQANNQLAEPSDPASIGKALPLLARAIVPLWQAGLAFPMVLVSLCGMFALSWVANRRVGLMLILSAGTLLALQCIVYGNAAWHAGTIFLSILAAFFLMRADSSTDAKWRREIDLLFCLFLGLQFLNGIQLIDIALRVPSSDGRMAAAFLRQYCPEGCTYVGENDVSEAAIVAYTEAQPMYFVNRGEFGTFAIRDNLRSLPSDPAGVAAAGRQFPRPIMIFSHALADDEIADNHLKLLKAFPPAMTDEQFFLYVPDQGFRR